MDCLKGKTDLKEAITPYLKKWGWNDSTNAYLDYWFESQKNINKQLIEEIQSLKKKRYKVFVATNQEKYRAEYLVHKLGFGEIFDGFYASSHIGEIKSNPAFFHRLLEQIELKPNETLFWDDSPTHVTSAKSVGMYAELYTSYEDFKKKMDMYLN
ncbi:MAG: HAD-IA family hydrolase [Candidatus Levyibacteriota bacterium]